MKRIISSDIGEDDFDRRARAVARKLRELTGCSAEVAEELAESVAGSVRIVDDAGNLVFRTRDGAETFRLPDREFTKALR